MFVCNIDILSHICISLPVEHIDALRVTCIEIHRCLNDDFFRQYAYDTLGCEFWKRALARPIYLSHPLRTWRDELIRIELFQRMVEENEHKRWDNKHFFTVWQLETKKRADIALN